MTNSKFNKEQLIGKSIFELRHIGREIGVVSPTSRPKMDLVEAILVTQETPPDRRAIGSKRGRPVKHISLFDDLNVHLHDVISNNEVQLEINNQTSFTKKRGYNKKPKTVIEVAPRTEINVLEKMVNPTVDVPVIKPTGNVGEQEKDATLEVAKDNPANSIKNAIVVEELQVGIEVIEEIPSVKEKVLVQPTAPKIKTFVPRQFEREGQRPDGKRYDTFSPKPQQREDNYVKKVVKNNFPLSDSNSTDAYVSIEKEYVEPQPKKPSDPIVTKRELKLDSPVFSVPPASPAPVIAADGTEQRSGCLEICPDGYGFLRAKNYEQGEMDAYIANSKIRRHGLRKGDMIVATVKKLAENRPYNVIDIISINGCYPEAMLNRPNFDALTPIYPEKRFNLELPGVKHNDLAIRSIDLVAPIGRGQRAMLVSPPKAGKTTLLKKIAHSIMSNSDAHLIVLLIDERPEEVTDMQRSIEGEVVYSTFDEMPEHHIKAAELVLERAKRLVEMGRDVVILLDSLTRLARAYNLVITPTGKTLSGGIDPGALHSPKRFFGAARNIENGGSLTIIATALVDTGSRMDEVIYEEFKGTGNMEIHLDRKLSEKRVFPAIDLNRSGTRREELLLNQKELEGIWAVRKMLSSGDVQEATENLISMMVKTRNNVEFIEQLNLQIMKLQKEGYSFRN